MERNESEITFTQAEEYLVNTCNNGQWDLYGSGEQLLTQGVLPPEIVVKHTFRYKRVQLSLRVSFFPDLSVSVSDALGAPLLATSARGLLACPHCIYDLDTDYPADPLAYHVCSPCAHCTKPALSLSEVEDAMEVAYEGTDGVQIHDLSLYDRHFPVSPVTPGNSPLPLRKQEEVVPVLSRFSKQKPLLPMDQPD